MLWPDRRLHPDLYQSDSSGELLEACRLALDLARTKKQNEEILKWALGIQLKRFQPPFQIIQSSCSWRMTNKTVFCD